MDMENNKSKFIKLLNKAIQPVSPKGDKRQEHESCGGCSGKRTRQDKAEDVEQKQNDKSRGQNVLIETKTPQWYWYEPHLSHIHSYYD